MMVVYSKLYLFKGVIKILITVMLFCFSLTSNAQRPSNKDSLPSVKLLSRVQENQILLRWAVNEPLAWKKTNTSGFAFGADIAVDTGDLRFLIFYARFQAGAGFDIMLRDYGEAQSGFYKTKLSYKLPGNINGTSATYRFKNPNNFRN